MLQRIFLAVFLIGIRAGHGLAQEAGQIVGAVTDTTGAFIPGVAVKATEAGTGYRGCLGKYRDGEVYSRWPTTILEWGTGPASGVQTRWSQQYRLLFSREPDVPFSGRVAGVQHSIE